jgi:hypothetical protein
VFEGAYTTLMISVDLVAAYGRKIICESEAMRCTVVDDVLIERGHQEFRASRAELDLRLRKIRIHNGKTVDLSF